MAANPRRPTIADVARTAGVGIATVDRVLNRRARVGPETARRVLEAAEAIGFHAVGLLKKQLAEEPDQRTFGFLLQKKTGHFYQALGLELAKATRAATSIRGRPLVEFLDALSPDRIAEKLAELGAKADAVALVAADHPKVSAAVDRLHAGGVPSFALLSDLTAQTRAGYIGVDHRKAGRTAAWTIARLSRRPGKIAIFVGSHRYIGHELCEISFRSYFREHAPEFQLLEPLASLEEPHFAYEGTLNLLKRNPDLVGLYVAGGGMEGVIAALRDHGGYDRIVAVCNELIPDTRAALIDGVLDLVLATPLALLAQEAVGAMTKALAGAAGETRPQILLPCDLYIAENI